MPTDFEIAYANAKKNGLAEFNFNGKQYNTGVKNEPKELYQMPLIENLAIEQEKNPRSKYVRQYNTGLTEKELEDFKKWGIKQYGSVDEIQNQLGDYDLQGAYKDIKSGKIKFDPKTGHLPDTYKKPNHITFSTQSKYHNIDNNIGGQWLKSNGQWSYVPSETTLKLHGKEALQDYFKENEPDSKLILE